MSDNELSVQDIYEAMDAA